MVGMIFLFNMPRRQHVHFLKRKQTNSTDILTVVGSGRVRSCVDVRIGHECSIWAKVQLGEGSVI